RRRYPPLVHDLLPAGEARALPSAHADAEAPRPPGTAGAIDPRGASRGAGRTCGGAVADARQEAGGPLSDPPRGGRSAGGVHQAASGRHVRHGRPATTPRGIAPAPSPPAP